MPKQAKLDGGGVYILLANGFAEHDMIACMKRMRQTNILVSLVGITAGLVTSEYGLKIKPDYSLEEVKTKPPPKMIVIPNGIETYVATDPRIYHLVDDTLDNQGTVASMSTANALLNRYADKKINQIKFQERGETAVFIDQLIDIVT